MRERSIAQAAADTRSTTMLPRWTVSDTAIVASLLLAAWLLYRPEIARPFDYVDFPDNILILKAHTGFLDRFQALMAAYQGHGRWSPVTMSLLAAQWSWFEWWTPGWQLLRFTLLGGATGLTYWLCRRLGLSASGASVGAALLVVSPPAVTGWIRLSTAEPVGLLFVLIASILALSPSSRGTSWSMAIMLLLLMWTKEIMTASFLLPILLATVVAPRLGSGRDASAERQFTRLVPCIVVFILGALPILATYLNAPVGAFATRYGNSSASIGDVIGATLTALLPFAPIANGNAMPLLIAVSSLLLLLLAGWYHTLLRRAPFRREILLLGIALPVTGAVIYAPWPDYLLVYALPFLLAGVLVIGRAVSSLAASTLPSRTVAVTCVGVVLSTSTAQAFNDASRTRALHMAVATTVRQVAGIPGIDTVLVAVAAEQFDARGNFGSRFWLYARAIDLRWPMIRDVPCDSVDRKPEAGTLLLRVNAMCEGARSWTDTITIPHRRFDWPNPIPRYDELRVDILRRREGAVP